MFQLWQQQFFFLPPLRPKVREEEFAPNYQPHSTSSKMLERVLDRMLTTDRPSHLEVAAANRELSAIKSRLRDLEQGKVGVDWSE